MRGMSSPLALGLHGAQQDVGVTGEPLQRRHVGLARAEQVGDAELGHPPLHVADVVVEAGRVSVEQLLEAGADVRDVEHLVVRDVRQADPQSDGVVRKAPLLREGVHVGQHHGDRLAGGPGERQFVVTQCPHRQVPGRAAGHHAQEHRPHHPHDLADEGLGGHAGHARQSGDAGVAERVAVVHLAFELTQLCLQRVAQGTGEALQEVAFVIEEALGPLRAVERCQSHGLVRPAPRDLLDLQLCDTGQLLDGDAVHGVDVGLGLALRGDGSGELRRGVPTPAGVAGQHAGQVLQEEPHVDERVPAAGLVPVVIVVVVRTEWTGCAHALHCRGPGDHGLRGLHGC